ncbi:MAG: hypothetical protein H6Q10_507 [Acidobacteria bacterium]|nr:hypothetical protein [Acidobacteriota bacterium]
MLFDRTRKAAAAAVVSVAALAAGCGGDGNPVGPGNKWALTVVAASEQHVPVQSATVRILDGADAGRTATTDQSGTALFASVQEGTFTIEVTAQDFNRATTSVTLNTSRTVSVTMTARNKAPVITSLVSAGGLDNQPTGLADAGQQLQIVATVTDVETPVENLTFEWSADVGIVTGSASTANWRAPSSGAFPLVATIGVKVIERFTEPGSTTPQQNTATGELKIHVHRFEEENAELGLRFLRDFSDSDIPADTVISRSFSTSARCAEGRAAELQDVTDNRNNYIIRESRLGAAKVEIHFESTSPFRSRPGDAWIDVPCGWTSTVKADGTTQVVNGVCKMTSVYDVDRWALCWSDWQGDAASIGTRFIH